MQALVHLRQATVPKIFLTATLVPHHQQILADAVGISLTRTLVFRSPTARPNHKLQIAKIPRLYSPPLVCLQLASLLTDTWGDDRAARGIIFVRSLKKLEQISNSSPFPVCTYSGQMSDQQKDDQLNSWLSDSHPAKWMVSTTALLHGVDYPRVDAVIFSESPFGLYDFVQGAGRAGRSGQESLIAVLYNGPPPPMPNESQHGCRVEMAEVLSKRLCRRASISKVMDGDELSCSEVPNSLPCDICEGKISPLITRAIDTSPALAPAQENTASNNLTPRSPPTPPPTALLTGFTAQASTKTRKDHAKSIKDLMERFSGCFTCRIESLDHRPCHNKCGNSGVSGCLDSPHRPYECTKLSYKVGWISWKKQGFLWPRDISRCYFCGLPNNVVDLTHKVDGKYPGICQFSDTAVTAAWHVLNSPQLFERLQKEMGFTPGVDAKASFATWLTQYGSDSEDIRLLSVFSWLCRQFYPDYFHSN
jgi:hypothetical protein